MHRIRTEALVDQRRPHDFPASRGGIDVVVGQTPGGRFSVSSSLRIRRCGLASAAATVCQPYRMTGPSGLVSRSRQAGRRPDWAPLSGALPPPRRK